MKTNTDSTGELLHPMKLRAIAGWTALATAFCWGLWTHLGEFGIHDWDQHLFYHAVPWYTLLEFGQFPSWNPFYCGGNPLFAHPESRFLTPMFVFELLWGPVVGTRLEIWAHLVVGLVGMHVVAAHVHGLRRWAALLPPIVFMMSGAYAYHLAEGHTHFLPLAYVPWVYFSYHRSLVDIRYVSLTAFFIALMIFEGGIYITSHTGLLVAVLATLLSVQRAQWRPLIVGVLTCVLAAALSAVKILPMLELLQDAPRRVASGETVPLNLILTALFSRQQPFFQLLEGQDYGWWEYANYIGILSGLLSLVGAYASWRARWPLLVAGIVFLELAGGAWAPVAPWTILHLLPVFDSYHVPSRFLYVFTFVLSLFAGIGLARLDRMRPQLRRVAPFILFVIAADLLMVNSHVFDFIAAGPLQVSDRAEVFTHVKGNDHQMYSAFLQNKGTLNCNETVHYPIRAVPVSAPEYRGEVYMDGQGTARITSWSPNRITVAVTGVGELTLNQNYAPGWNAEDGRTVYGSRGLITTRTTPGDQLLTLYYQPPLLMWGLVLTAIACLGSLFLALSRRYQ